MAAVAEEIHEILPVLGMIVGDQDLGHAQALMGWSEKRGASGRAMD